MILLTPTLGSRNYFHPESPLLQMITWSTEGFRRYSPMFSRDFEPVAFAIPYHRNIPMYKYIHLPFLLLFLVDLVITRYPEIPSIVPRIFVPTALQFLATWITLRIISCPYRVSAHPQIFMQFTKFFEIPFGLPKILSNLLLLKFLLACIMVNPISIEILLTFLVIIIVSLLTQYVANTRNHHWSL